MADFRGTNHQSSRKLQSGKMELKKDGVKFDFANFKEIAKHHKKMWVETSDRGDIPPTVFVEKDGKVVSVIVAPQVDKHAGLHAAHLARMGFDADALSIIMDAHATVGHAKPGQSEEEREEEFRKKYPPGSMQKMCDDEGACERGEIVDILLCQRIDRDGNFRMFTLPYSYHGKGGPEFKWLESDALHGFGEEKTKFTGFIPDSLKKIMAEKQILDHEDFSHLRGVGLKMELDSERQQYHASRSVLKILNEQGFLVFDFRLTPDGDPPDPIVPLEKTISLTDVIPEDALQKMSEVMERDGGREGFKEKLIEVLLPFQSEINERGEKLEIPLERISVEIIAEVVEKSFKKRKEPPFRVKVMNGDQTVDLGLGTYVGEVPVYFIEMPDGSLRSLENAEIRPSDEDAKALGGKVCEAGRNPKIVLDKDGTVVYGCQIWWDEINEGTVE